MNVQQKFVISYLETKIVETSCFGKNLKLKCDEVDFQFMR